MCESLERVSRLFLAYVLDHSKTAPASRFAACADKQRVTAGLSDLVRFIPAVS